MSNAATALIVTPEGDHVTGRCACCGRVSRCVWGTVSTDDAGLAAYYVHWSVGHVAEVGADLDLIIGRWGDGTSAADRCVVRLHHVVNPDGVMVQDAAIRGGLDRLVTRTLLRAEVIGTPLAAEAFAIYDAIIVQDARLAELRGTAA
ncbi:hypothetical protein RPB_1943 [Rhodopseudomonas palustris HaA2]|uniref:Uncharacterized protein n=1 Tax=Rhodopseudomonas palustris (strain HaA2) TaxID=316058 RepID=Q2IYQ9_RHOP2|nr:hypothetical protein [Rhodopseudomonas palustris]ABD06651.1 hypothetical protein RPB_1943 [Rhodopseudomonas palustris HaA2]